MKRNNILSVPWNREVTERENDEYLLLVKEALKNQVSLEADRYRVILKDAARIADYGDAIARQLGEFHALGYRNLEEDERWHLPAGRQEYQDQLSVSRLATELPGIFPPGSKLYVFSNIWNQPGYFRALEQHYRVFRYYDFPMLRQFIEGRSPNTFMLYAIEKRIAEKAQKCFRVHWHPSKRGLVRSPEPESTVLPGSSASG